MQKAIKSLLLLAVLAAVVIGAAVYLSKNAGKSGDSGGNADSGQPARTQRKKDEPPMREEEKLGFTTETVSP